MIKITKVRREDIILIAAHMVEGICSNPVNANLVYDQYARQQVIYNAISDVAQAFMSAGVTLDEDMHKNNEEE